MSYLGSQEKEKYSTEKWSWWELKEVTLPVHATLSAVTMREISIVTQLHTAGLYKFAARAKGDSRGADYYFLRYRSILKTTLMLHGIQ